MRVLVTGANGFIGRWVVRALIASEHDVVGVFRPGRGLGSRAEHPRFSAFPADLYDGAEIERVAAQTLPEVAVHLAWYTEPRSCLRSPQNLDSLAMTVKLARALYERGCRRIVGVGSCAEYSPKDRPLRESDSAEPRTPYGVCKRAACAAIEAIASQEHRELAWARIFHVHGPGDADARLIPSVVHHLLRGNPVELTDGLQRRDHLHVADVGSAIAALAVGHASGIVNVCSGQPVTLRQVIEIAARFAGRPDLLRFGARPRGADDVAFLVGDPSRLHGLGWTPRFGLDEGIRDAVDSVRSRWIP